ncbi:hypothetical protein K435DRAFT_417570 [Dendrothele bispora CBS 962.96]|uniref:Uncharacterized protein n=1 Tax=Dendrothele bispora (strain CBS 962.96) TaxID=1314807 RepID=A0A4S8MUP5_DENBC|nr:hypothetical protein K435DRAFT_417570 [Dendrothele bispora CBS 962.96]
MISQWSSRVLFPQTDLLSLFSSFCLSFYYQCILGSLLLSFISINPRIFAYCLHIIIIFTCIYLYALTMVCQPHPWHRYHQL